MRKPLARQTVPKIGKMFFPVLSESEVFKVGFGDWIGKHGRPSGSRSRLQTQIILRYVEFRLDVKVLLDMGRKQ